METLTSIGINRQIEDSEIDSRKNQKKLETKENNATSDENDTEERGNNNDENSN